MQQNLTPEEAYQYVLDKLKKTDRHDLPQDQPFFLIYQTLMDLYRQRDSMEAGKFFLTAMSKINDVRKKLGVYEISIGKSFHDFSQLGCLLKELNEKNGSEIFEELKRRRNVLLKSQKTLRSFLILDKGFENENLLQATRSDFSDSVFKHIFDLLNDDADTFTIELNESITEWEIQQAIKDYYVTLGFTVENNHFIEIIDSSGDVRKWINLTYIPKMFREHARMLITVNELK